MPMTTFLAGMSINVTTAVVYVCLAACAPETCHIDGIVMRRTTYNGCILRHRIEAIDYAINKLRIFYSLTAAIHATLGSFPNDFASTQ